MNLSHAIAVAVATGVIPPTALLERARSGRGDLLTRSPAELLNNRSQKVFQVPVFGFEVESLVLPCGFLRFDNFGRKKAELGHKLWHENYRDQTFVSQAYLS